MNDCLIIGGIPLTLFSNLLTFKDTNKSFNLDGGLIDKIMIPMIAILIQKIKNLL